MKVLNVAIHEAMAKIELHEIQEMLLIFLQASENRKGGIGFTILNGAFQLHSFLLVEYFAHSLTFVFLFAPLLNN